MYCFAKICCLCLQYNTDLYKLEEMDQHGVTFFEKLIVLMPGFEELVKKSIPNYICRKCKRYLNKFYKFQQNCLKSYTLLESYVKQLDNPDESRNVSVDNEPEMHVIEDDLILMREDMEECLKNMEIYIKVEDSNSSTNETTDKSSHEQQEEEEEEEAAANTSSVERSPKSDSSNRKRTRECKKISYNEDYDSDAMVSDSELYYTKGAKRKAKPREEHETAKGDKTVVIPQNNIFAKDLTKTINDIITRLSAGNINSSKPEEVKMKFKNSSGNTEQLSIYQDKDTVEVKFTKEEKMGYLKVCRSGDSYILSHNMSETSGGSSPAANKLTIEELDPSTVAQTTNKSTPEEVAASEEDPAQPQSQNVWNCAICSESFKSCYSLTKHVNNYMNLNDISCKICDKTFEHVTDLKKHIYIHSPTKASPALPSENASQSVNASTNSSTESPALPEDLPKTVEASASNVRGASSPRTSQCSEIKVVLSEIQENPIKSERSSSPEYQFHLSDDTDDEFDNDTIILGPLDNETDFTDTRSPSPVVLGSEILDFLKETDAPKSLAEDRAERTERTPSPQTVKNGPNLEERSPDFAGFPRESVEVKTDPKDPKMLLNISSGDGRKCCPNKSRKKSSTPEDVPHPEDVGPRNGADPKIVSNGSNDVEHPESAATNGEENSPEPKKPATNGVDLSDSFEEKLLKIVINKMEVEDYLTKSKNEKMKKSPKKIRSSPRQQTDVSKIVDKICVHCKESFKTQRKLKNHLENAHQIFTYDMEA